MNNDSIKRLYINTLQESIENIKKKNPNPLEYLKNELKAQKSEFGYSNKAIDIQLKNIEKILEGHKENIDMNSFGDEVHRMVLYNIDCVGDYATNDILKDTENIIRQECNKNHILYGQLATREDLFEFKKAAFEVDMVMNGHEEFTAANEEKNNHFYMITHIHFDEITGKKKETLLGITKSLETANKMKMDCIEQLKEQGYSSPNIIIDMKEKTNDKLTFLDAIKGNDSSFNNKDDISDERE